MNREALFSNLDLDFGQMRIQSFVLYDDGSLDLNNNEVFVVSLVRKIMTLTEP